MTVKEQHIHFDLVLAQLGSNVGDHYSEDIKDWYLNVAMLAKMGKLLQAEKNRGLGFDDSIYRNHILQNLVEEHIQTLNEYDSNSHYGFLPDNYFAAFTGEIGVDAECTTPSFLYNDVLYDVITPQFETTVNAQAVIEDFIKFKIYVNTDVVTGPSDIQELTIFGPLQSVYGSVDSDIYYFIEYLVRFMSRNSSLGIYVGQFADYKNNKGLVFARKQDDRKLIRFAYYYSDIGGTLEKEFTVNVMTLRQPTLPNSLEYKELSIIPFEKTQRVKDNPFSRSIRDYCKGIIVKNKVIVPHYRTFVPYTLKTTYIRRPRPIIYSKDWNCELGAGTDTHDLICKEIAAEAAALAAMHGEAPNFEVLNIDFLTNNS